MNSPIVYSMALVFSEDRENVLLIEKNRPEFLRGKWTGVGGHVEPGETPLDAVAREVEEETGLAIGRERWREAGVFTDGATFVIHLFASTARLDEARTITEEPVASHPVAALTALPTGPRLDEYLAAARACLDAFERSAYATGVSPHRRGGFSPR